MCGKYAHQIGLSSGVANALLKLYTRKERVREHKYSHNKHKHKHRHFSDPLY